MNAPNNYETPEELKKKYQEVYDYEPTDEDVKKNLKAMYPDES